VINAELMGLEHKTAFWRKKRK